MSETSANSSASGTSKGRLPNGADKMQEAAGALAADAQSILQDRLSQVRQAAASAYDAAKVRSESAKDQMDVYVRGRPWESVSFAALIYFSLDAFSRRDSILALLKSR